MNKQDIISSGLLELYAAGLASAEEAAQVQQAIADHPEVAEEFAKIEAALFDYAAINAVQPAASVKDKIFDRINKVEAEQKSTPAIASKPVVPIYSTWRNIAAAAILLLVGSTVLNIFLYNKNTDAVNSLVKAQASISKLEDKTAEMESNWKLVQSKYSQPVALSGMGVAPDAAAKVFWMKNTGDVYIDPSNLPEAPAGKQYHLWGIVDSKPVDAGIVLMDKKGNRFIIQKMKSFGKVEAFAVSLEDAGKDVMPAPQGDIYVMGKM